MATDESSQRASPATWADREALMALKVELDLREELGQDTTALRAKIARALDPRDPEPGVLAKDFVFSDPPKQ